MFFYHSLLEYFIFNISHNELILPHSTDMQLLVGTCSRSLDELKQTPSRKFFALNDSKESSFIMHQINNTITDDKNTNIVTINTSEEKRYHSNKRSQKVNSQHHDSSVINGNMNIPDNDRGLLLPHMNLKKSSGTLCAEVRSSKSSLCCYFGYLVIISYFSFYSWWMKLH